VRQTRKLIIINKESYHFIVPRSGFLINPFRFISNIAQGLGGLCTVRPTVVCWTIGQADQGPSVRWTLIYEDNRQDARPIGRAATPKPGSI